MSRSSAFLPLIALGFSACFGPQVLVPEPSALDLDTTPPACPGITNITLSAGPSLTVEFGQASDNVSESSKISYDIFLRSQNTSYDLVSPAKIVIGATVGQISTGVTVGQTYTLFVACRDEAGNSFPKGPANERSIALNDTLAPTQITDLVAGSPTQTTILLRWSPSDDGIGGTGASQMRYRIYGTKTPPVNVNDNAQLLTTETAVTSFLHEGLNPQETWRYKVVAVDASGNPAAASNEAQNTTSSDQGDPYFIAGPSGIDASSLSQTSIEVSWNPGADAVTVSSAIRYNLYRCSGSTTCDPFALAPYRELTAQTSYTDTNLTASTVYVYGVRVRDLSNNLSTNSDKFVTSTEYSSTGSFYATPTLPEANQRLGQGAALGHFYGPVSGGSAYMDLALGAPNASEGGGALMYTGCVYIYEGLSGGRFSTQPVQTLCQPSAAATGNNNRNFGFALAKGDFNGDGFDDLVASAPQQNRLVYYFYNSGQQKLTVQSSFTFLAGGTLFGYGLCAGKLDADAVDDVVVLVPGTNCWDRNCGGLTGTGNYAIYNNSSGGLASFPAYLGSSLGISAINDGTDQYTITNHGLNNDDKVIYVSTGGVPGGIANLNVYFVRKVDNNTIELAATAGGAKITGGGTGSGVQSVIGPISSSYASPATAAIAAGVVLENNDHVARSCTIGNFDSTKLPGSGSPQQQLVFGSGEIDAAAGNANEGALLFYRITGVNTLSFQNLVYGNFPNNLWGDALAAVKEGGTDQHSIFVGAPNDSTAGSSAGAVYSYQVALDGTNFTLVDSGDLYVGGGDLNSNGFGTAIAAGSVTGQAGGRQDIVVGAAYDDQTLLPSATAIDAGTAYLFKHDGTRIDAEPDQSDFDPWVANAASGQYFGSALCKGDVNDDGLEDIIVGAPGQDYDPVSKTSTAQGNPSNSNAQGAVYVYFGTGGAGEVDFANPSMTLFAPGNAVTSEFGSSCLVMDYNGDGEKDLLVGAPRRTMANVGQRGAVYVYQGQPGTGISSISSASLTVPTSMTAGQAISSLDTSANSGVVIRKGIFKLGDRVLYSRTGGSNIGGLTTGTYYMVADVSSVSSTTERIRLRALGTNLYTSASFVSITGGLPAGTHLLAAADGTTLYGWALATGDWDGNGKPDLAVSAPNMGATNTAGATDYTGAGRVFVYFASSGGSLQGAVPTMLTPPFGNPGTSLNPHAVNPMTIDDDQYFGYALATYNRVRGGNGGDDLVVCTPNHDVLAGQVDATIGNTTNLGHCLVYRGALSLNNTNTYVGGTHFGVIDTSPILEIRYPYSLTNQSANITGFGSAATTGYWDDDLYPDLVICGVNHRSTASNLGACFAYLGKSTGGLTVTLETNPTLTAAAKIDNSPSVTEANTPNFGRAVLLMDINNNERDDLIIGEPASDSPGASSRLGPDSGRVFIKRGAF